MKIEIRKVDGISRILLDGKPVERGCMGFQITSNGAGAAMVELRFLVTDMDFSADVDAPVIEN